MIGKGRFLVSGFSAPRVPKPIMGTDNKDHYSALGSRLGLPSMETPIPVKPLYSPRVYAFSMVFST